ncbi:MAG: hypothetical protein KAT04_08955 [Methylococcales bacterium]|nr:hypothetical protein [Methylococcales bacterium]
MNNLPNHEDFKDSLVAFIDILGFDNKIRDISCKDDFFEVGKLLYATKKTSDNLSRSGGILKDYKFTAISDSIIVSVPFTDPVCTVGMLSILHNLQYELLATDFKTLIRGYITKGSVYHKDGVIFGAGYSDAYKGERMIGGAPRIVVDPKIVKSGRRVVDAYDGESKMVTIFDYLSEDISDGFYFIDYLKPVGSQRELPNEQLLFERESIKEFVMQSLSKYDDVHSIRPKYKWLENYFLNSAVYFK